MNEPRQQRNVARPLALVSLVGAVAWSYAPTLSDLWAFWQVNQDYSVGMLVPLIAAYLVWRRRTELARLSASPCWWGLAGLLLAQVIRMAGVYYDYASLERMSLFLTMLSLVLLALGATVFWRLRWVMLFLALTVPPPGRIHRAVSLPLQDLATSSTVFLLELGGEWVTREGNVLRVNDGEPIAVAEACSGLRMLAAFVVVGATFALLVSRPAWQRIVLSLSSIPIAIGANALRLVCTVAFFSTASGSGFEAAFHDIAGFVMMPVAVALMLAELHLLDWIGRRVASDRSTTPSATSGCGRRRARPNVGGCTPTAHHAGAS